jgi:hypothetical protein
MMRPARSRIGATLGAFAMGIAALAAGAHTTTADAATTDFSCSWPLNAQGAQGGFSYDAAIDCSIPMAHMNLSAAVEQNGTVVSSSPSVECGGCATISTQGSFVDAQLGVEYQVVTTSSVTMSAGTWPSSNNQVCTGWGTPTLTCKHMLNVLYLGNDLLLLGGS